MAKGATFYPRNKKEPKSWVYMAFRWSGNRIVIPTRILVQPKYWDSKNMRVKATSNVPNYKAINARFDELSAIASNLYSEFALNGVVPSESEFKTELLNRVEDRRDKKAQLIPFIHSFIEEKIKMNKPKGSIKVYKTAINHLEAYAKAKRKSLDFKDMNEAFKRDFVVYLLSQNFADAYIHKLLSTLLTFIRDAKYRDITDVEGFKIGKIISKRSADHIYLTENDISVLAKMDLSKNPRLDRVRDLFLIGCFTGLRFSDYSQIKPENIRVDSVNGEEIKLLNMTTQKTKQKIVLPLVHPELLAILEKYNMRSPRKLTNQKMNEYLKELAQLAGFNEDVEINEYRAGQHEKITKKKWELVSTHTARRSFATNAYKRGVLVADIMKFTGHTTVTSFMKYIRVTEEETALVLSGHEFFTGKTKLRKVE